MKAYLLSTGSLFGFLVVIHIWRAFQESQTVARDPWYWLITAVALAFCVWAFRLVRSGRRQ